MKEPPLIKPDDTTRGCRPRAALTLVGGVMVHLALGAYYTFGKYPLCRCPLFALRLRSCPSFGLSAIPSIRSICRSLFLFLAPSLSVCVSLCGSVCLSACLSVRLSLVRSKGRYYLELCGNHLTLYQIIPTFHDPEKKPFENIVRKGKIILVTGIFSFSYNVCYLFQVEF